LNRLEGSDSATFSLMSVPIHILSAIRDGDDGVLVTFSDGTCAGYVVEELLDLRPHREPAFRLSKPASLAPTSTNVSPVTLSASNGQGTHAPTAIPPP